MTTSLIPCLLFCFLGTLSADAALTITCAPDGTGGTTYTFVQTSPNPTIAVALAASGGVRIDLPPGMFDPIVRGEGGSSDISGSFDVIARFQDAGSGFAYDVVGLLISSSLSHAFFEFAPSFSQASDQTQVQFELVSGTPGVLGISPEALVEGTHSIDSPLFGTVTVTVIPEPGAFSLSVAGALLLSRRRRGS